MNKWSLLFTVALISTSIDANAKTIKVAIVQDFSGSASLADFAKQLREGFEVGLDQQTGGTGEVNGNKIELIFKDTTTKPDRARAVLAEAFEEGADIAVGSTSSGISKAMLPIAKQYGKPLIVDGGIADSITGADWNPFIFKTARNSSMDMQAQVIAMGLKKGDSIATIGDDYLFTRDGIAALKVALAPSGIELSAEEYVPTNAVDITPALERVSEKLKDVKGRKVLFAYFGILPNALSKVAAWNPTSRSIETSAIVWMLPDMAAYKAFPGMKTSAYYYYDIPKNPVNENFVSAYKQKFGKVPDLFGPAGYASASAIVAALKATDKTDGASLVKAMEGLKFPTPKGEMTFRADDHQAMMSMYQVEITVDPAFEWAVPKLVRVIGSDELQIPIRNKR